MRYYIDPTPNSCNKFTRECVAAREGELTIQSWELKG